MTELEKIAKKLNIKVGEWFEIEGGKKEKFKITKFTLEDSKGNVDTQLLVLLLAGVLKIKRESKEGSEQFKAHYQKPGKDDWKRMTRMARKSTDEEAQADLDAMAKKKAG